MFILPGLSPKQCGASILTMAVRRTGDIWEIRCAQTDADLQKQEQQRQDTFIILASRYVNISFSASCARIVVVMEEVMCDRPYAGSLAVWG